MNIVVAKYNEDISWISKLNNHNVIVYDKSGDTNSNYIPLPNIGREAHTYLTYIIDNYDNLPEYTCFLQGDAEPHIGYGVEHIQNPNTPFHVLGWTVNCDLNGLPHHKDLDLKDLIFERYFLDHPQDITFVPGAQFIVHREAIKFRSKKMYELLLEDMLRTDLHDHVYGANKMPWVLERVWSYIFNKNYRSKYDV